MFENFPSLTRFSHGWTITEKLDGANAAIVIVAKADPALEDALQFETNRQAIIAEVGNATVFAQSRKNLVYPGKASDNYGFAQFVKDNAEEIVAKLGEGRHFGEWIGKGVNKRAYNLDRKRFVLFNTHRWTGADLPERVDVVPVLAEGYIDNPGGAAVGAMDLLKQNGSVYAPGFMNPEGVVMRHGASGTLFKKTFDYDEQGKWAENEARRNG
jgi:RNA ligase